MGLVNADFYDADGSFNGEAGKQAYLDMMERFGYPIPPALREGMWAIDFALGDFVHVGMGGVFWCNSAEGKYFGHEIFLLGGQMIVEHCHVKTDAAEAKMEAWHVRHGMIHTFGEGDATDPPPVELPAGQADFITARHAKAVHPGELDALNRPEARHFMIAGPEGAIVTEYASYHDNDALRFTNPDVKF